MSTAAAKGKTAHAVVPMRFIARKKVHNLLWPVDLVSYVHPQQTNSGIQPSVSGVGEGRSQLSQQTKSNSV